jgi:hypothetical protein
MYRLKWHCCFCKRSGVIRRRPREDAGLTLKRIAIRHEIVSLFFGRPCGRRRIEISLILPKIHTARDMHNVLLAKKLIVTALSEKVILYQASAK